MIYFVSLFVILYHQYSLGYCNNLLKNWGKLSNFGVIKCNHENSFDWNISFKKIVKTDLSNYPVVISYKCNHDEKPIKFTFKGEVKNYELEGPGKLRIPHGKNLRYDLLESLKRWNLSSFLSYSLKS